MSVKVTERLAGFARSSDCRISWLAADNNNSRVTDGGGIRHECCGVMTLNDMIVTGNRAGNLIRAFAEEQIQRPSRRSRSDVDCEGANPIGTVHIRSTERVR